MDSLNLQLDALTVRSSAKRKVAIIGSGVAGLAAAKFVQHPPSPLSSTFTKEK